MEPVGGRRLPASHDSLARGVAAPAAGTVSALSLLGGVTFGPKEGRELVFGRNRPQVHVCLGENDLRISRRHGTLVHGDGRWWVHNLGAEPIRIAETCLLFRNEEPVPLEPGYTPLFIRGSERREHLLEIFVNDAELTEPGPRHRHVTYPGVSYDLTDTERLVLVVLGQRYLRREPRPQPWTRQATTHLLTQLQPDAGWKRRRVEELVTAVRQRLSRLGVPGLTADEVPQPIGNMLNHNLIQHLMQSGTLVPRDLALIDFGSED
ncbi:FHA domain-containing protein [Nocardia blacklockiae]|uniref:FHA domain-containing protein n=1 Tax=Nocardia blacklockiae TaxID=480036 RepID=UPI001894BBEA|nr:FHA domain-containing protein [Nocardia blacklockiae]MBF6175039.1 FHA domain-containing protein [Nocardia blacklockiae]